MKDDKDFRFHWEERLKKGGPEINIELPGFSRDEIHVSIEGGYINISAEKKEHRIEKDEDFYHEEAMKQSLRRSMSLPRGVDPKDLDVKIDDGAVRIRKR